MRNGLLLFIVALLTGCQGSPDPTPRSTAETALFGPMAMRIHPIFTRVKDWSGDDNPDGVEALIELQDQFGDPTKSAGRVIFELYSFQKYDPQRKGERLCNPWIGALLTMEEQRDRWNRTSRTYSFPLAYDGISAEETYVLTAQFESATGKRFFDQIVLEPARGAYARKERENAVPTTQPDVVDTQPGPATEPGMRPPAP